MTHQDYCNAIERRHSCRSFTGAPLPEDVMLELKERIDTCPDLRLISGSNGRVGSYGVVSGSTAAVALIGDATSPDIMTTARDAEEIVLWLTSRGIGSCWLGGTFHVSGVHAEKVVSAVIVLGIPADNVRWVDSMFRKFCNCRSRLPFEQLFTVTDGSEFGDLRLPLEMMRLAPSARNKQPWRVVVDKGTAHFFCVSANTYSYTDMGIALCHFSLTTPSQGSFITNPSASVLLPSATYITSWQPR